MSPPFVAPALLALLLTGESLFLALLYFGEVSPRHLVLLFVAGLLPWPLLGLRRFGDHRPPAPGHFARAAVLAVGTGLLLAVQYYGIWKHGREFLPAVHDEWSYLFGAETLAAGSLTAPAPPEPDLFRQVHVLVLGDRWMSRYPPGHPALLALGVKIGAPFVVPLSITAFVASLLVWWMWKRTCSLYATACTAALLLACPGLHVAGTTYLSQSSFLLWAVAATLLAVDATRADRLLLTSLAAVCGGAAFLTRPYSAVAMLIPIAFWACYQILKNRGRPRLIRHILAALPGALATLACWFGYNYATTGDLLRGPWLIYNERYEPANLPGFGPTGKSVDSIQDPVLRRKAIAIEQERRSFTLREAIRRSFLTGSRLRQYIGSATTFVGATMLLGVVFLDRRTRALATPFVLAAAGHYLAYGYFYSRWGAYPTEAAPLLCVVLALGAVACRDVFAAADRPLAALYPTVLVALNLLAAAVALPRLVHVRQQEVRYHKHFLAVERRITDKPALLFIRLDPNLPHPYDPIHNDPFLLAPVLRIIDPGPNERHRVLARFRDRAAYVYDEATGLLRKLRDSDAGADEGLTAPRDKPDPARPRPGPLPRGSADEPIHGP